ncbi:MAG: YhcN/YlaJ family sporulation lipoprotein [Firmicutes bacterium]|nr:YhcN/YlaJ family sporulation lipoprotein [Bacillota bacterium]
MKAKRFWVLALGLFIAASFFCGGCGVTRKPLPPQPVPNQTPMQTPTQTGVTDNGKAGRIAREADKVNGVNKSTVVVSGNKAFIGLDINPNIKGNQVKAVENAVCKRIKGVESSINTVYVTSNAGFVTQVKDIARGIGSGRAITDFDRELKDLGRQITPRNL